MDREKKTSEKEVEVEVISGKDTRLSNQESLQKNLQDIDQEQSVNANPFQFNSQNVQVVISDKNKDYSGGITGITYLDKYNKIVADVIILLYFGGDTEFPVAKTSSDNSGKYIIDNIPPGYYTIQAYVRKDFVYSSHYIKVLPCEKVEHLIFLKYLKINEDF